MQDYEIKPLMSDLYKRSRENWEQSRLISYVVAQSNSTKKITPSDIIKFPWENKEDLFTGITSISNDDVERLKLKSKQFINNGK